MSKFRKKPVVVEAVQFFYDGVFPIPGVWYPTKDPEDERTYIGDAYVITIHGQRAYLQSGDWVITEPDGEHHYPCKPDIFEATYEAVGDDNRGDIVRSYLTLICNVSKAREFIAADLRQSLADELTKGLTSDK